MSRWLRSSSPHSVPRAPQSELRLSRWAPVAVVSVAVLLYLNILPNTFIFDDWQQIFDNPFLRYSGGLKKIFTTNVWGFLGRMGISNYYRPLMHSTFYVTFRMFGFNPAGYHALSIALHALVSLLVYAVVLQIYENADRQECRSHQDAGPTIALFAALLFAAHPIHTENVCWISNYPDLQAAFFILLVWWVYLKVQSPKSKVQRILWDVVIAVSFFLGLLAKEIAVAAPLMALAYEFLVRRAGPPQVARERWAEYLAMAVAASGYLVLRYQALGGFMPYGQTRALPPGAKLLTDVALFYRYWAITLWPAGLNVFHHILPSRSAFEWRVLAGAAAAALFFWVAYRLAKARRPEVLALVLFLVALGPAFTLPYGDIGLLSERYLYVPSVGFCWLVACALVRLPDFRGRNSAFRIPHSALAALVVLLTAYSARTLVRNLDWRSEIPFYLKAASMSPGSAELFTNLGEAYLRHKMLPQALTATERAASLRDHYAEAHNNLGQIYSRMGQPEKAIQEYVLTVQYSLESQHPYAAAGAYTNLGYEYRRMGKLEDAIRAYQQALALDPQFAGARNNLAYALMLAGQGEEAERQLKITLQDDPALALAHSNLGLLYAQRAELDRAAVELAEAARLEPNNGETYARLGDLALARGQPDRAERLFRHALQLHPDNERAIAGLGRLRGKAEAGRQ